MNHGNMRHYIRLIEYYICGTLQSTVAPLVVPFEWYLAVAVRFVAAFN